jgi:RNA-directed DNA polymerase
MEKMMQKLKLTVNPQKTRVCQVPEESFDFLGYTLGRCYRAKTGTPYIGTKPSKKAVAKLCEQIHQMTERTTGGQETEVVVGELNLKLKGWANYFCLGSVSKAYRIVDGHVRQRLRRWLCRKHKVAGTGTHRYSDEYLEATLGLTRLSHFSTTMPWAKAK